MPKIAAIITVALLALLGAATASADTSSTLTIVGTSDVSDSGLVPNLIQPQFHAAFPQYTFKYVGSATGAAIQSAENGTGGPSALIVHAASLENQFVAGGFSYKNQYGNAIFTNDFVLAGWPGDPAGVDPGAANNIAQAFADVAAAGDATNAKFFVRGGTNNAPGTTVAEHAIWALVNSFGLAPASLVLCNVSAADGGGMTPIKSSVQATSGQACPDSGSVSAADAPAWYQINSGNQAANVIAANTCSTGNSNCYVFTDRGTFDFLSSGQDPAGTIPNLSIVTRKNSASAPGGPNALTNYFHVYIINPSVSGETVNLPAAQDFVNFLTGAAFQSELKTYLDYVPDADANGVPFIADASPTINVTTGFPSTVNGGQSITVAGNVVNNEPGYQDPSNATVSVNQVAGGLPGPAVATGQTDQNGHFSISFKPPSSGSYQISTGSISQIEDSTLTPVYGDILSPAATATTTMTVDANASIESVKPASGAATVTGSVGPTAPDDSATISVLARHQGSKGAFRDVGGETLKSGQETFAANANLGSGKWQLKVSYSDPGQIAAGTSGTKNVTISPSSTGVKVSKAAVKNGKLTLNGKLSHAAAASGAHVLLLALRTGRLGAGKKHKTARAAAASFKQVGKTSVKPGKSSFTVTAKLGRGYQWILQLEFVQKGQPSSFSKLSTVNVR